MTENLKDIVAERFNPFQEDILAHFQNKIHSITITGSALTDDFDPKRSDINSVFILNKSDFMFLEQLAPLGKKYGKKGVSAPLIMTPEYIMNSLDVFPLEFLNIKLLHKTVFGEDLFQDLVINQSDLRLQCERELKIRMIGLRQGYISSAGDKKLLAKMFADSFSGYIPLFKGIILISGKMPPLKNEDVLKDLESISGVDTGVFKQVLEQKIHKTKLTLDQLNTIFESYYKAIEKLGDMTDAI
jgi:hypothetical protein